MQDICTYIPETNHVPREYSVSAVTVWGRLNARRKVINWSSRRIMSPPGCHQIKWGN